MEKEKLEPQLLCDPRQAMLDLMENYMDVVFEVDEVTVQGLREGNSHSDYSAMTAFMLL